MKRKLAGLMIAIMCIGTINVTALAKEENKQVTSAISIKTQTNSMSYDYRAIDLEDIEISENVAGALQKGKTLNFKIDKFEFMNNPEFEVEGDLKVESVKVKNGILTLKIEKESKTPSVVKIQCDAEMEMRNPVGYYDLYLVKGDKDMIFQNTDFDVDERLLTSQYIAVVNTAPGLITDSFKKKVTVDIENNVIVNEGKVMDLDVPAYISEDYVMMPVRAVTEAMSDSAVVGWDEETKQVTILFGARTISMTVGSKIMNINGVEVPMNKSCEIKENRVFLPLRDFGYALGLNDNKITWNEQTQTATYN